MATPSTHIPGEISMPRFSSFPLLSSSKMQRPRWNLLGRVQLLANQHLRESCGLGFRSAARIQLTVVRILLPFSLCLEEMNAECSFLSEFSLQGASAMLAMMILAPPGF